MIISNLLLYTNFRLSLMGSSSLWRDGLISYHVYDKRKRVRKGKEKGRRVRLTVLGKGKWGRREDREGEKSMVERLKI